MLSAPPPPTPTFATLTLTPARVGRRASAGVRAACCPRTRARRSRSPGPAAMAARRMPAEGAGYSPVNGEIYRHEVLGEADPRPCDLKTVTASRVRVSGAQTGAAGGRVQALGVRGSAFRRQPRCQRRPQSTRSSRFSTELAAPQRAREAVFIGAGGVARPRETPPPLTHSWNNVTKIMNGFSSRSSRGRRLGGALRLSFPRRPWFASSRPPSPRLTHAHTRVYTRARTHARTRVGVQCQRRFPPTNLPASAPLSAPPSLHSPLGAPGGGLWARGGRWAGSGRDCSAAALRGRRAPSFDPGCLAPAPSFAPSPRPQPRTQDSASGVQPPN